MNLSSFIPHSTYAQQGPELVEGKTLPPRRLEQSFEQVLFEIDALENGLSVVSTVVDAQQEEPEVPGQETVVDTDMLANTDPVDSDQSDAPADVSLEPLNRSIRKASIVEVIAYQVSDGSVPGADGPTGLPNERPASGPSDQFPAVAVSTTWRANASTMGAGDRMQSTVVNFVQTDPIEPRPHGPAWQSEAAKRQSDTGGRQSVFAGEASRQGGVQDLDFMLRNMTMTGTSAQADPTRVNESLNQKQVHSDAPQIPVTHRAPAMRGTHTAPSAPAEMVSVATSTKQNEALVLAAAEGRFRSAGADAAARSDASGQHHTVDETNVSAPDANTAGRGGLRDLHSPAQLSVVAATPAPGPLTNETTGAAGHSQTAKLSTALGATQINRSLPPEMQAPVPLEAPPASLVPKNTRDLPSASQSQPAKLDTLAQRGQLPESNPINTQRFRGESDTMAQPVKIWQALGPAQTAGMTEQPARPTDQMPSFARQPLDGIEELSVQLARDGDTAQKPTERFSSTARPRQHLLGGPVRSVTGGNAGGQQLAPRTIPHTVSIDPAANSPLLAASFATGNDVSAKGTADRFGLVFSQVETRSGVGSLAGNLKLESQPAEGDARTRQTVNLAPRGSVAAPAKIESQKPVDPPEGNLANPQHDKTKIFAKNDKSTVVVASLQTPEIRLDISRTPEAGPPFSGATLTKGRSSSPSVPPSFSALGPYNIGQAKAGSVCSSSKETLTGTVALPGASVRENSMEVSVARTNPRRRNGADRTQPVSQETQLVVRALQAEPRGPFQGSAPTALAQPVSDQLGVSQVDPKGKSEGFVSDLGSVLRADGPQSSGAWTTHTQAVSRTDFGRHVAAQIIDVLPSRAGRPVEVSLNPEELGRVRMTVITGDSGVILSIIAERPETLDLLRRHIDQLATDLRRLGYESPGFEFSGSDSGQRGTGHNTDAHTGAPMTNGETDELPPTTSSPSEPTATPARAASGLDLRV